MRASDPRRRGAQTELNAFLLTTVILLICEYDL
jgi:hypothetical protein